MNRLRVPAMLLAGLLSVTACSTAPGFYRAPTPRQLANQPTFGYDEPQIERGQTNWAVDGLNHYLLSIPSKLLLWNWKLLDHRLPRAEEEMLRHYLETNGLAAVKVRHNRYAPLDEWRRLGQNGQVGAGYRYSLGVLAWLRYTFVPDRLFGGLPLVGGGDHFNPFTNTIHVYSSDLAILLHEAGHAKDYLQTDQKGTKFIAARLVPGVDLVQEARASQDAIGFLQCMGASQEELAAYRSLIPAYSTYGASYFGWPLGLPIVLVGHVSGRVQGWRRARDLDDDALHVVARWCAGEADALPAE